MLHFGSTGDKEGDDRDPIDIALTDAIQHNFTLRTLNDITLEIFEDSYNVEKDDDASDVDGNSTSNIDRERRGGITDSIVLSVDLSSHQSDGFQVFEAAFVGHLH